MICVEEKLILNKVRTIKLVIALANKIINELGFVRIINESIIWDSIQWGLSPGQLLKALVLATFADMRVPLTHLQDRLADMDLEYLLGYEAELNDVNAFNVGRALERLGEADVNLPYEMMVLSALQKYEIPIGRVHSDTTTISFYGEYDITSMNLTEEEKKEILQIEKGYNKDGRPGDKQAVVGQMVNETGIPIMSRVMDGSTTDIEWNKIALDYFDALTKSGLNCEIYVADCKLITEENVVRMNNPNQKIPFVSRCPANFDNILAKRVTTRAYSSDEWESYGQLGSGKSASNYRGKSYVESVYGASVRLLVLESSSLKKKAEKSLKKARVEVEPLIKALSKKSFSCHADAEKELINFLGCKEMKLFNCDVEIEKDAKEKWPPGRRSKSTEPQIIETYYIRIKTMEYNEEKCKEYLNNESSFVLISNILESDVTNEQLLRTYKGQHVVETSFRHLKRPNLASVIYLKNPKRVKALTMLLTFSLLVRAIIQYIMRAGLKKHNEDNPGVVLYAGWNRKALVSPTFKLFYEQTINCQYVRIESDKYSFNWPDVETKEAVTPLLDLMNMTISSILQ